LATVYDKNYSRHAVMVRVLIRKMHLHVSAVNLYQAAACGFPFEKV